MERGVKFLNRARNQFFSFYFLASHSHLFFLSFFPSFFLLFLSRAPTLFPCSSSVFQLGFPSLCRRGDTIETPIAYCSTTDPHAPLPIAIESPTNTGIQGSVSPALFASSLLVARVPANVTYR